MPNLVPIYKHIGNAILTIFLFSGQKGKTTFHSLLNTLNDSTQFTMEKSHKELPFLDLRIIKNWSCISYMVTQPICAEIYRFLTLFSAYRF